MKINEQCLVVLVVAQFAYCVEVGAIKLQTNCCVTTAYSTGRLGDHFFSYLRVKIVARALSIPHLYRPFPEACWFHVDQIERAQSISEKFLREKVHKVKNLKDLLVLHNTEECGAPRIYELHRYADIQHLKLLKRSQLDFDDELRAELKRLFVPIRQIPITPIPDNCISVAVHVRRPSGPDSLQTAVNHASKFMSMEQYAQQIDRIAKEFPDQTIYVKVFTESTDLVSIARSIAARTNRKNLFFEALESVKRRAQLLFSRRRSSARGKVSGKAVWAQPTPQSVLSDLCSMVQFDCLIRPVSAFSAMAEVLGDYKVVIRALPKSQGNKSVIGSIEMHKGKRAVVNIVSEIFGGDSVLIEDTAD